MGYEPALTCGRFSSPEAAVVPCLTLFMKTAEPSVPVIIFTLAWPRAGVCDAAPGFGERPWRWGCAAWAGVPAHNIKESTIAIRTTRARQQTEVLRLISSLFKLNFDS